MNKTLFTKHDGSVIIEFDSLVPVYPGMQVQDMKLDSDYVVKNAALHFVHKTSSCESDIESAVLQVEVEAA